VVVMPFQPKKYAKIAAVVVPMIIGLEGVRTVAYKDSAGIPTICMGETLGVQMGDTATEGECDAMLNNRLPEYAAGIDRCLPPDLPDKVYVAFLSAAYNIGINAFCNSSMARRANEGKLYQACNALLLWVKTTIAGVKVRLPGLVNRREQERALCLEGLGVPS
jgi:lysozyme